MRRTYDREICCQECVDDSGWYGRIRDISFAFRQTGSFFAAISRFLINSFARSWCMFFALRLHTIQCRLDLAPDNRWQLRTVCRHAKPYLLQHGKGLQSTIRWRA